MPAPIDFYFDFGSPYGYVASTQIDSIAAKHGRRVRWRPFLIGVAMQRTGAKPLPERPMLDNYGTRDFARSARLYGLPYQMPDVFPVSSVAASRAYYWAEQQDEARARILATALYRGYWGDNRDISSPATVATIASDCGYAGNEVAAALAEQAVKDRLRDETTAAIERGVFGSPFFIIDEEPFWGADRLWHVDRWLEVGGW